MADTATLQIWLTEAETARHQLATGKSVAMVNYEGKGQVSYTRADLDKLDAYIAWLRSQLSTATDAPSQRRRPIHLSF